LFVSLFSILLNVLLVYTLARPISRGGMGVGGLAMAQSIVATVEVFVLLAIMMWRDHKLFTPEFWHGVVRVLSVTGFTLITAFIMATLVPHRPSDHGFFVLSAKLMVIAIPATLVHFGASWLFGLEEVEPVVRKFKAIILKPVRIQ